MRIVSPARFSAHCSHKCFYSTAPSNLHDRKTNHQKHAKAHRDHLEAHFVKIDAKQGTSFAKALLEHCPKVPEQKKSKKRKSSDAAGPKKKPKTETKTLAEMTQSEREENAMENLRKYIQENGGECSETVLVIGQLTVLTFAIHVLTRLVVSLHYRVLGPSGGLSF